MPDTTPNPGVLFLGPRCDAEGGIATVLRNYRRTLFWHAFRCRHLPTMMDATGLARRVVYEVFRLYATLASLIAGPVPAAVSIHCAEGWSFYRKLAHLLVVRLFPVPIVLHVHPSSFKDFFEKGGYIRQSAIRLACRYSDQVVFLSESTRLAMQGIVPLEKSTSLGNPVDVHECSASGRHSNRSESHVLFMGWIIREKGVYDLLDAIPLVLEKYPKARFTFAGNKEVERLRHLVVSRGLSAVVDVPGWVAGDRRLALLRSATVLVLPSYTEGLPNVILEAMASGLPVIATGVGAIPDVVKHGHTGLLIQPGDVSGIANAITTVLSNKELRRHISESAFCLVDSQYSLDAVSGGLTAIYSRYIPEASREAGEQRPDHYDRMDSRRE